MHRSFPVRGADEPTRRGFLTGAAQGLLGVSLAPGLDRLLGTAAHEGPVPTAHRVIYLYLSGGMSHVDTFDPKDDREVMGDTTTIPTAADGIRIGSHLEHTARVMDRVAVVNSMWSNQGAHVQGRYFLHTGYGLRGTIRHPSLGAWLSHLRGPANPTLPPHVAIGGDQYAASAGFFASAHAPLPLGDPEAGLQNAALPRGVDDPAFDRRMARLKAMNQAFQERHGDRLASAYDEAYDQAVELMRSRDLEAFAIDAEAAAIRDAYGRNRFGQGCLLARRLIEHDVRFVEVVSGGWDMHNEVFDALEDRVPEFDRAFAALIADLDARGLLETTLVVVATEFGRTPKINGTRNGRDHHPKAFSCLLAGGGIRGGVRHGRTDERGEEVVEGRTTVPDFNATIAMALGLPLDQVVHSPTRRPFTVADKGRPLTELFA